MGLLNNDILQSGGWTHYAGASPAASGVSSFANNFLQAYMGMQENERKKQEAEYINQLRHAQAQALMQKEQGWSDPFEKKVGGKTVLFQQHKSTGELKRLSDDKPVTNITLGGYTKSQEQSVAKNLRGELNSNPIIKNYRDISGKYQVMGEAMKEARADKPETLIAVDQALITLFNKMTDPESVVRESEYARTPNDQALVNTIKGKAQKILTGGAGLTLPEREGLFRMAANFNNIYRARYGQEVKRYEDLALISGINPKLVTTAYENVTPSTPSAPEKTVVERRKTKSGKVLVKYSDGTIGEEK